MFGHPIYSVVEDVGPARPVLVTCKPPIMKFNVTMSNTDGTATGGSTIGEYCSILINYNGMTNVLQEKVLIIFLDHTMSQFLLE